MISKTIHEQALRKLVGRTETALRACVIENGSTASTWDWYQALIGVWPEVEKHRGTWLSSWDFMTFANNCVRTVLDSQGGLPDKSGPLPQLVPLETLSVIARSIADVIESIPRPYRILLPVPKMISVSADIAIAEGVSLIHVPPHKNAQSGLLSMLPSALISPGVYLSVPGSGFASSHIEQSAFREGISNAKRVLYLAILVNDIFASHDSPSLAGLLGTKTEPILRAYAYDEASPKTPPAFAELPVSFSRYLRRLTLNDGKTNSLLSSTLNPESLGEQLPAHLAPGLKLILHHHVSDDTTSFASALQWAFDARSEENKAMSLVKICIALEAVLSETPDKDQITERLADRCAFLLGANPKMRGRFRLKIRELYRIRSKVVHGTVSDISGAEREQLRHGVAILDEVLSKELAGLLTPDSKT